MLKLIELNPSVQEITVKPGQAYPQDFINEFMAWICYSKVESVGSCRFQIHLCILACVMSREFTREAGTTFLPGKEINPFKDFLSYKIQRSSRKIFTAHYACRNAALNLTLVTATTNGFIFRIISSLIESWGVRLTCLNWTGKRE